jgi:peptide/nickel transport system ATP-binding protein
MTALIELRDVRRDFHVGAGLFRKARVLHAVNGVTLSIAKGEVMAIVGESGCGKTTLARMILGLLPVTAGTISIDGIALSTHDRHELARRVQPVFQDPYASLNPRKSIRSIVGLPLVVHDIGSAAERKRKVEDMIDLVGLPRRVLDSYPNQLSGGQRQRVAIARALVMRPEVVVCDEPTSALDVSVQSQILNLLQELQRELGLTYIFISHNLAVVEHIATRVAVMYLGRIVEEAETTDLFGQPRHPYTRALLASVLTPEPGLGIPDTKLGVAYPNPINPPSGCTFHPRCPDAFAPCARIAPRPLGDARGHVECHLYDDGVRAAVETGLVDGETPPFV